MNAIRAVTFLLLLVAGGCAQYTFSTVSSSSSSSSYSTSTLEEEGMQPPSTTVKEYDMGRVEQERPYNFTQPPNPVIVENDRRKTLEKIEGIRQNPEFEEEDDKICGGTDIICSVEADTDGDGERDCCTNDTNPMCTQCLTYCVIECEKQARGVGSCFFNEGVGAFCECSDSAPSCYELKSTTTSTQPQQQKKRSGNSITYLIGFAVLLVGLVAAVQYVYRSENR